MQTAKFQKLMESARVLDPITLEPVSNIKSWQTVNQKTGEVVSKYKYLEGHPRQYHFDAKEGVFSINGREKIGNTLTLQPIVWRIFNDSILKQLEKQWAELFFIDESRCVSTVLFHGYSVDNIFRLIETLYYDDLNLADVIVTATAERKENAKIQPKGIYHIARFSYELADADLTKQRQQYVQDNQIYRQDTQTDPARFRISHYYNVLSASSTPKPIAQVA